MVIIDPNSIIEGRKNYWRGIIKRSLIINFLKKNYSGKTSEIANELGFKTSTIRYHLKLLHRYNIIKKKGIYWSLSKNIQRTLDDFMMRNK